MPRVVTVYAPHEPDGSKLGLVSYRMSKLGPPTIKAWWDRRLLAFIALEGSHRLAAAAALKVPVTILKVVLEDMVCHDFQDLYPPGPERVGNMVDYILSGPLGKEREPWGPAYRLEATIRRYQTPDIDECPDAEEEA